MIDSADIVNIILHVVFSSVFIGIFYFTYTSGLEQRVLQANLKFLVDNLASTVTTFIPATSLQPITRRLTVPDMTKDDQATQAANQKLIRTSAIVLGGVLATGLLSSWLIARWAGRSYLGFLKHNLVVLAFVAATEWAFLNLITKNYRVVDPNRIKAQILQRLKDYSSP